MKAEPTLNEMCEYIENNRPNGFGHTITHYKDGDLHLFIHSNDSQCRLVKSLTKMKDAIDYIFNYYFAVNNK